MAVKRITPDLKETTLSTKIRRDYKDVDLNFANKPGTKFSDGIRRGDVYKREDVRAIDQSISNILSTNYFEKPFQPFFGANLVQLLFELNTTISETETRRIIAGAIQKDEPRVEVLDIEIYDGVNEEMVPKGAASVFFYTGNTDVDRYSIVIYVHCRIKNTGEDVTIPINMNRLR